MPKKLRKIDTLTPQKFQRLVLAWFNAHGRKTLPWQQEKNPYRVWVSEIMLQQTQVTTVVPYFQRFMLRFPDVQSLASATEDEVLHEWTGLGYYNRARNLHRTAKIVTQDFHKKFPANLEELQALPGIGRSTAGAILAIAFQQHATILDGNVKRVLTRLHGITTWPGEKKTVALLWQLAEKYTPHQDIANYTQAMMDIGATLCVRGNPQCHACPFVPFCEAHHQGIAKILPKKKPSVRLPVREVTLLVLLKDHFALLEKRPPTGVWGSLWSLPEVSGPVSEKDISLICQQRFACSVKKVQLGERFRHTFSHFHLDITPAWITAKSFKPKMMEADQQIWYNLQQPNTIGLPAPIKSLLMEITL